MKSTEHWSATSNGRWLGRWLDRAAGVMVALGYLTYDFLTHRHSVSTVSTADGSRRETKEN